MKPRKKLLGLCGSLRARSSNRAMLQAYARLCADAADLTIFEGLSQLPHFNPDDDGEAVSSGVQALRNLVNASDAIVVSTPEYAHGLPGALKNALDWLVSDPAFAGKRIVIVSADRGSTWALDSLREILRTMSAEVLDDACVALPLSSNAIDVEQLLSRPEVVRLMQQSITRLLTSDSTI